MTKPLEERILVHAKNGKDVEYTLDQLFLDYFTGLQIKAAAGATIEEHTQAAKWLRDNVTSLLIQALREQRKEIREEILALNEPTSNIMTVIARNEILSLPSLKENE